MNKLSLRVYIEGNPEKVIKISQQEFIIGRLPECDLCLPFSEISRYHSRLIQSGKEWLIEDLGSTNGTMLNQLPITKAHVLRHNDVIQVGNVYLSVLLTVPTAPIMSSFDDWKGESRTILRKAEELQQQWIDADEMGDPLSTHQTAIARLKDLVEIAKKLSSAESIEAIFDQVKQVAFRELKNIERIALLIDITETGKLELLNAAARDFPPDHPLVKNSSWISQSICQKVFSEKVAIKLVDAQSDEQFGTEHSILMKGIRGALAVPLWDKDKVVGVLYADAHLRLEDTDELEDEDLSFFSTLANLVASSVQRWLLTYKLQEEEQLRQKLERYNSPSVVQQLLTVGALENGRLIPKESDISILFADLVGFTALSERLTPTQIADLLNNLFEEMLQYIFASGGTLDKYIGDCIMAFFGAPEPQEDHAERAVKAALGMLDRLDYLNSQHTWPERLELRIAINSGKAVAGDVGCSQRVDYTVLGATVNLASRMESVCAPGECLISEATYRQITNREVFIPIGEGRFKGIDRPIMVYQTRRG
jgi:adenylate cyclase